MVRMDNEYKRAREIAQETKIEIIDMNINDWATDLATLSQKMRELQKKMDNSIEKLKLWSKAKAIKIKVKNGSL